LPSRLVTRLADLALRRPWALLGVQLALLAGLLVFAVGAPERLGIGSLALDRTGTASTGEADADLVIATRGDVPVRSRTYRVALQAISLQVRLDPDVASVRREPTSPDDHSIALLVSLSPEDEAERQQAVERIEDEIDPGPLRLAIGGAVVTANDARDELLDDLGRLELLAAPLVLLVAFAAFGLRLAAAPVLCAATAVAGSLAGLRLVDGFADVSLLGSAPGAIVGLALGVEAPSMLVARFRDEASISDPPEALGRAMQGGAAMLLPFALATAAATTGVLVTPLDQGPSIVFACVLACVLAAGSSLLAVPALVGLELRHRKGGEEEAPPGVRGGEGAGIVSGIVARSRARSAAAVIVAVVAMGLAAVPVLAGETHAFSASDLPGGSEARAAERTLDAGGAQPGAVGDHAEGESLFPKLVLAAAVSAGALALVFAMGFRSLRLIAPAIASLLPAAAACGLCVLAYQAWHPSWLVVHRDDALETGAVASLLVALAAVSANRGVAAIQAVREERFLGLAPAVAAESASALTVPAAATATVIAAAMAGVLTGSDLDPARQFGFAVAAGVIVDLVLMRVPLIAALARWGPSPAEARVEADPASDQLDGLGSPRAGGG
jgi:uncharacterized membrane protein YdfJ with MMPL/SSD domain